MVPLFFAELVGNVHGVVLDRNVEVVERNDQQHVNDEVKSAVVVEHAEEKRTAPDARKHPD